MTDKPKPPNSLKLVELLWRSNMLNRELAELAGVTERTVYYWLSGKVKIPPAVIKLMELHAKSVEDKTPA